MKIFAGRLGQHVNVPLLHEIVYFNASAAHFIFGPKNRDPFLEQNRFAELAAQDLELADVHGDV
jgi:NAD(P)H-flavin reductase